MAPIIYLILFFFIETSVFDAWTKLGPSLLDGQSNFVGNYQQCREARAPESDKRTGFHGNYCAVTITNLTHTGVSCSIVEKLFALNGYIMMYSSGY